MVRTGRPKAVLVLSEEEREQLERWSRRARSAQSLALRSKIVLACGDGLSNTEVAARLRLAQATVGKWRRRFVADRLGGLLDEPRPGGPRSIGDDQIEQVIVATLERAPRNATHWSRTSMAAEAGISPSTVGRIWRAFNLKPHLVDSFKLSSDPQFLAKVRDVVGLYLDPPERALVLCVDEKSGIQALDRSAPVLPMMPGMPERRTHDYVRSGTTTLFAALDVASGRVIGSLHRRRRAVEFKKFLARIDAEVPTDLDVHLICDNLSTHKTPAITAWLAAHPRFHLHFTPTSSSWLNQVERWFALLTEQALRRGTHRSVHALEKDIRGWVDNWNEDPRPFTWTKTADQILERLAAYIQRIPGAGH
ncbi:MAG TPA: IS630 family transposase [Mycobacteriales bacterium]